MRRLGDAEEGSAHRLKNIATFEAVSAKCSQPHKITIQDLCRSMYQDGGSVDALLLHVLRGGPALLLPAPVCCSCVDPPLPSLVATDAPVALLPLSMPLGPNQA